MQHVSLLGTDSVSITERERGSAGCLRRLNIHSYAFNNARRLWHPALPRSRSVSGF